MPLYLKRQWELEGISGALLEQRQGDYVSERKKWYAQYESKRRAADMDKNRLANRRSYARHKDRRAAYARLLRIKRKSDPVRLAKYNKWCCDYVKRRKAESPEFKIRWQIRGRMLMALGRGVAKSGSTVELVGCSMANLRAHLESLWLPGMSWGNYGKLGWHIDHIKPCSSFMLQDPAQQRICFHYSNLQPLWWPDNLRKGSKT